MEIAEIYRFCSRSQLIDAWTGERIARDLGLVQSAKYTESAPPGYFGVMIAR